MNKELASSIGKMVNKNLGEYETHKQNKVCRICLHAEADQPQHLRQKASMVEENPLISPCECMGS